MARRYIEIIRRHQREGPYFLSGHCNGGLVVYDIARQLRAAGEKVGGLFLVDPAVPNFIGGNVCSEKDVRDIFDEKSASEVSALEPDIRQDILNRAYVKICRGYIVKPYAGESVLILADQSPTVTDGLAAGWKRYMQPLVTVMVPGGHHSMLTDHVQELADSFHRSVIRAMSEVS